LFLTFYVHFLESNDTGYVEENDIHVEMDSVGGETNATRIGGKKSSFSPASRASTNISSHHFDPNVHMSGSNGGEIKNPYVWKAFLNDAAEDGLGRTAYVELYIHLLSGTATDSFKIKINDHQRNQVLLRDQEGEAKDVFFRGKALAYALKSNPTKAQFLTSMLSEVTNNFTTDLTQENIISFPFQLRKKISNFVKLVPFISDETGEHSEISILFATFEIDWNDTTEFSSGPVCRNQEPIRCMKTMHKMPTSSDQGYHNKVTPKISNHRSAAGRYDDELHNIQRRLQELAPIGEDDDYEDDNSTLFTMEDAATYAHQDIHSEKYSDASSSGDSTHVTTVYSEKTPGRKSKTSSTRSRSSSRRSSKSNGTKASSSCNTSKNDAIPSSIEFEEEERQKKKNSAEQSNDASRSTKLSKDLSYSATDYIPPFEYNAKKGNDSTSEGFYSATGGSRSVLQNMYSQLGLQSCNTSACSSTKHSKKSLTSKASSKASSRASSKASSRASSKASSKASSRASSKASSRASASFKSSSSWSEGPSYKQTSKSKKLSSHSPTQRETDSADASKSKNDDASKNTTGSSAHNMVTRRSKRTTKV